MLEIRHERMDSSADTRAAYNALFGMASLRHLDSYYLWLLEQLKPRPAGLLLDISCGHGRLVTLARQRGIRALGVDFAESGVRLGQVDAPDAGWLVGDGECLPVASGSIDYATHIGSLEHYQSPERGAAEVARVLKPKGRACILLPNAYSLIGNIQTVWKTGEVFDDGQPLQRIATRNTWQALLESNGLIVQNTIGYGEVQWPRTAQDRRWMLRRPVKMVRLLLSFLIPLNFCNHFVFVCERADQDDAA